MATNTAASVEFWISAIREQAESGLTVTEYCQLIEKSAYQFYYWKRRVRTGTAKTGNAPSMDNGGFIELQPQGMETVNRRGPGDGVEIRIGSFTIRFTETSDPILFKRAAVILREIAE